MGGGRERHLHPVVRAGIWESSGKHLLADRYVGGHVGVDCDNHDEPVRSTNTHGTDVI